MAKKLYNITDSSDGSLLLTIETPTECKEELVSIKKRADDIWYKNEEQDEDDTLNEADQEIVDNTVNGDWVEIFHNLMVSANIDYEQSQVEDI